MSSVCLHQHHQDWLLNPDMMSFVLLCWFFFSACYGKQGQICGNDCSIWPHTLYSVLLKCCEISTTSFLKFHRVMLVVLRSWIADRRDVMTAASGHWYCVYATVLRHMFFPPTQTNTTRKQLQIWSTTLVWKMLDKPRLDSGLPK